MKRYEKYKKTNCNYLGSIPKTWDLKLGLSCFEETKQKNSNCDVTTLLQFKYGKIVRKKNQTILPEDFDVLKKYSVVNADNIVINGLNLNYDFISQRVGRVEEKGIITSAYITIKCRNAIHPKYANYLLKSLDAQKIFHGMGSGVRLTLGFSEFSHMYLPIPPHAEQDQIVRYLDWKVSRINKLIHAYQREIKLLEERKLVVINNAVTKGLDPHVEMKDSGVSWIGQIPKGWKKYRIKYLYNERNIRSLTGKEPHLSMSQKKGLVTDDENIERRLLSESYIGAKICHKDDLVLNRLKAHLGVFAIAPILGVVSPDYTVLKINQSIIIPKFAELLLKSSSYRNELKTRVRGIVEGFWRLYTEDLGEIKIYIPNLFEQKNIIKFIDDFNYKNNLLILNINRKIELLTEYRTRLISDVVTGQIDVRDVVIPNYEVEEVEEEVIEADDDVNGEEVCDGDEC